ncbi:MAG: hypothetical protein K2X82_07020 [Gemmataceae bacterium]|nr:hypothetical protein [Gemmataceae bacterium]
MAKQKPAREPTTNLGVRVPESVNAEYAARCKAATTPHFTGNKTSVTQVWVAAFIAGMITLDEWGKLVLPALSPPAPVPESDPAPVVVVDPDPVPGPPVDVKPPMPESDYLGLNAVAYWYRNRKDDEPYADFLAAFGREREAAETLAGWCVRTRSEEGGGP